MFYLPRLNVIIRNDKNPKAEKDDPGPQVCLDSNNKLSMLEILDIFSVNCFLPLV